MLPTTDTRNSELRKTLGDGEPSQVALHDAEASPAAGDLGPKSNGNKEAPGIIHDTVNGQGGKDASGAFAGISDTAPAGGPVADGLSDEELGAFDDSHLQVDKPKKKKKKSRKPKSKRGLNAPTGFEEYSADAPITPAEYDEEKQLYDPDLPFPERIITAIHRYERRRKMNATTRDIFYKYLAYGGLDVTPNMFQGVSKRDAEAMDKDTLTAATAQSSLSSDFRDIGKESSNWVVDFEGVMKGFLSRRAPFFYALDTEAEVKTVTNLLINFMNYLLHHDVCPEYREPILAARQCCIKATHELWSSRMAQKWLPGDFNIACSTLFDGTYGRAYDGQALWADDTSGFVGQTDDQARQIIKFAVACAGSEEQYQLWYEKAMANKIKVTNVRTEVGLEITKIILPDDETREFYKQKTKDFRPVGKIYTKGWKDPAAPPDDLTPEERALRKEKSVAEKEWVEEKSAGGGVARVAEEDECEFFLEEVVLRYLFVGMKLEATVRTLNCGIRFMDAVFNTYVSFDTFLPNERLYGYKKPKYRTGFSVGEDGLIQYNPEEARGEVKDDNDVHDED